MSNFCTRCWPTVWLEKWTTKLVDKTDVWVRWGLGEYEKNVRKNDKTTIRKRILKT